MNKKEIKKILKKDLLDIIKLARLTFKKYARHELDLCSIINAKSGACPEDCKFCAQSVHYSTGIEKYPLKSGDEILKQARIAQENKVKRFGIVTSGRGLREREAEKIAEVISVISREMNIKPCASLGVLNEKQVEMLKKAGLKRYHHNIETSRSYYPHIVTTHSFEERLRTIKLVKSAGIEICSGGIIGLGESMDDRIDMALLLRELDVDSVPLNILVPVKGTPLAGQKPLGMDEIIKTIAMFRIILKDKTIKIAAGRESVLKDFQALAFLAGANGMLVGGYLTIRGREIEDDMLLCRGLKDVLK